MKARSQPMSEVTTPTYQELGIKYNDASNWQNMAKVPEEVIEDYIETTKLIASLWHRINRERNLINV